MFESLELQKARVLLIQFRDFTSEELDQMSASELERHAIDLILDKEEEKLPFNRTQCHTHFLTGSMSLQ